MWPGAAGEGGGNTDRRLIGAESQEGHLKVGCIRALHPIYSEQYRLGQNGLVQKPGPVFPGGVVGGDSSVRVLTLLH